MAADRRELVLSGSDPLRLRTRVLGLFLFLPLLVQLGFDKLVRQAGYPGSEKVPADAALLSLLALKLRAAAAWDVLARESSGKAS